MKMLAYNPSPNIITQMDDGSPSFHEGKNALKLTFKNHQIIHGQWILPTKINESAKGKIQRLSSCLTVLGVQLMHYSRIINPRLQNSYGSFAIFLSGHQLLPKF